MRARERAVPFGVPILGHDDVIEAASQRVNHRHHLVAAGNRERAARTEVVLDVDDQKRVLCARHDLAGHRACLPFVNGPCARVWGNPQGAQPAKARSRVRVWVVSQFEI